MTVEMLKPVFVKAFQGWNKDQVPRLSAALTFYVLLALSPMLLFFVAGSGLLVDQSWIERHILFQIKDAMGDATAAFINSIFAAAHHKGTGIFATLFGLAVAMFGASGIFEQLRDSINAIWGVVTQPCGIWQIVVRKLAAFVMVIVGGVMLVAWLILDSRLHYLHKTYALEVGSGLPVWEILSFVVSMIFLGLVSAAVFKYMPEREVRWSDVWFAAIITGILLTTTKYLLSLYFAFSSVNMSYGSAGAVVLLLLWVYYSAQIFFFGVELCESYALAYGSLRGEKEKHENVVLQGGVAKAPG